MAEQNEIKTNPNTVGITCKDAKASIAFYRDRLGFTLKECWPDDKNPMWANMVLDQQSIMIGQASPPDKAAEMCADDPAEAELHKQWAMDFQENKPGAGVSFYIHVPDVNAYHDRVVSKGVHPPRGPKDQFYGLRDLFVTDPDGYNLVFYTPVKMTSCQSCGMPLKDSKPGQMYCHYCADETGKLKPYEVVFEGTVSGYFMHMQKMSRPDAEKAAREHLAKMPAWAGKS